MTVTHKFVELPPLPEQFRVRALKAVLGDKSTVASHRYSGYDEQRLASRRLRSRDREIKHIRQWRYHLGRNFESWVRESIAENFLESGVSIGDPGQGNLGPHTDRARDFVLIYVLVPGGSNVRTCFWQEQAQPVIRSRTTFVDDYDTLIPLDQVDLGTHRWAVLDSRILHSAQNLEFPRISIQIAFDDLHQLEKRVGRINFFPGIKIC